MARRLAGEGKGDGSKRNGNGDEVGGQATVTRLMLTLTPMTWAMATAMRLVGEKEGKGKGCKGDGDGTEGGGQQRG